MKQLKFNFMEDKKINIPDFETWYSENSHEKRQYGEKPYSRNHALKVYAHLKKTGFWDKGE
tara:strand:- start:1065 stop:1247 length:183 start_codon:yes stop_codon:yes gene_type:complete